MKTIKVITVVSLLLFVLLEHTTFAQTTIYTPESRPLNGWVFSEYSNDQINSLNADCNDLVMSYGLNATMIVNSSGTYNCHGYAWSKSENTGTYWIGAYPSWEGDPEVSYWSDANYSNDGIASYIPCSEEEATHAIYIGGDHSVRKIKNSYPIAISGNQNYISKWRDYGLYRHQKGHDIFNLGRTDNLAFYKLKVTHSGTLTSGNKTWVGAGGIIHSLSNNLYIPAGCTVTVKTGATVDLNGYIIFLSGGSLIIENGATLNGAYLKQGSGTAIAVYPTIQAACNVAVSGQIVELVRKTYNENFSLTGKSNITVSGYGATVNGSINLNGDSYCNLYGIYLPSGGVYISGGIGLVIMDVRSDAGSNSLYVQNSTNNAVYGLTATNGNGADFGVNIYNSTGDICRSSRIENQMVGIYLYGTSSYNVTEDYFCNNGFDVDAEGGAYAYLLHNTYSRVHPISAYGNYFGPNLDSALACSSPSSLAKSNTASLSLSNQSEVKGTPAGDLDLMYLDLIHRTSQDTALDHKGRIDKYKAEYLGIAEKSKGELKKSFNDLSKLKKSLSLTANCLRYLGEEGSLTSYLNELLGMSDLQPYSPYIKKYFIPGMISRQDYTGALALCDGVLKAKDIDQDLTCEILYEKGLIHRFYLNNNTEAYRAFSSITAKYPNHPLGKMAMGQISDMPELEIGNPELKPSGSTSEGFNCSNYPNPFNPSTRFTFSIPANAFTELKIYNSLGQEVKTLVSDYLTKGKYTFEWNAGSYSSGIYYYFLKSGSNVTTSKIILLK